MLQCRSEVERAVEGEKCLLGGAGAGGVYIPDVHRLIGVREGRYLWKVQVHTPTSDPLSFMWKMDRNISEYQMRPEGNQSRDARRISMARSWRRKKPHPGEGGDTSHSTDFPLSPQWAAPS